MEQIFCQNSLGSVPEDFKNWHMKHTWNVLHETYVTISYLNK
jgi:hypothetical protein